MKKGVCMWTRRGAVLTTVPFKGLAVNGGTERRTKLEAVTGYGLHGKIFGSVLGF